MISLRSRRVSFVTAAVASLCTMQAQAQGRRVARDRAALVGLGGRP